MRFLIFIMAVIFSQSVFAGTWIDDKDIVQVEVRTGSQISVTLANSDGLCETNRIYFEDGQWINQDAVNQYFSLLLMAKASDRKVSIHVELSASNRCYGRIGFVE